jgi:Rrf2 family transcriptional regulator, nitric oxide-sensitive transcriptional repressor
MRLTRFTDFGLRVLLYVGRHRDRICTMGEIATHHQISLEHLRKVVHKMAGIGYLRSSRGRGGGLLLGMDAGAIRIGDAILALEEDLNIVDCEALDCKLAPGCSLKIALDRAGRAFVASLNEVTLADLLGNARMQRQFRAVDALAAGLAEERVARRPSVRSARAVRKRAASR